MNVKGLFFPKEPFLKPSSEMFNLPHLLQESKDSGRLFPLFWKSLLAFSAFFELHENCKASLPELKMVQLNPTAFYLLLAIFFFLFFFLTYFFSFFPEILEKVGEKEKQKTKKFRFLSLWQSSAGSFFFSVVVLFTFFLSFSLELLLFFSEDYASRLWTYFKTLGFQSSLSIGVGIFSQFPLLLFFFLSQELQLKSYLRSWKKILLLSLWGGALITPSADPFAQLGCSLFALLLLGYFQRSAQEKQGRSLVFH